MWLPVIPGDVAHELNKFLTADRCVCVCVCVCLCLCKCVGVCLAKRKKRAWNMCEHHWKESLRISTRACMSKVQAIDKLRHTYSTRRFCKSSNIPSSLDGKFFSKYLTGTGKLREQPSVTLKTPLLVNKEHRKRCKGVRVFVRVCLCLCLCMCVCVCV